MAFRHLAKNLFAVILRYYEKDMESNMSEQ